MLEFRAGLFSWYEQIKCVKIWRSTPGLRVCSGGQGIARHGSDVVGPTCVEIKVLATWTYSNKLSSENTKS